MRGAPPATSKLVLAAAGAAAVASLLWRVAVEPVDFGYVRYLAIADEMARSGDWVVMRLVDDVYVHKPPLFFWLMAPIIAALGEAPGWVAHVPDLLALALSLVCVHRLGAAIFGTGEPALASALVFATTWESFNQATGKRLDFVFAALLTAAFTSFYLGAGSREQRRPRQRLLALAFVALGLATLTKGPLAILLFGIVTLPWAAASGRLRVFAARGTLAGVALLFVVCAAWPSLLVARLGVDGSLSALRATDLASRTGDLLLYARSLPVLQLPWSLFFPALGVWLWRSRPSRSSDGVRFLVVWVVAILAVLHVPEARHQRYLQPVTPALSLLVTGLWYAPTGAPAGSSELADRLLRGAYAACLVVLCFAGSLAGLGLLLFAREPFYGTPLPPERWLAGPVALATGASAAALLAGLRRHRPARTSPLLLATVLLGALTTANLLAVGDLRRMDSTPLARAALAPARSARPVGLLGMHEEQRQMGRLLTRRTLPLLPDAAAAAAWARQQGRDCALLLTDGAGRRSLLREVGLAVRSLRDFELAQEPVELIELCPDS